MFFHQLKIALRNLLRHRTTMAINVVGLGVGIAAAIFTFWWVYNEYSYNRYHPQAEHIYRVNADVPVGNDEVWHWAKTPLPLLEVLRNETPEVERVAMYRDNKWRPVVAQSGADRLAIRKYAYVSEGWFDLFDHRVLDGALTGFHERRRQAVLTRSLANKLFGAEHIAGRILQLDTAAFVVAAVIEDHPTNSGFQQELILPLGYYLAHAGSAGNSSWGDYNYVTFVQLRPYSDVSALNAKLTSQLRRHREGDTENALVLQPLRDIYFDTRYENGGMRTGDLGAVRIVAFIGLIILLLACVNYVSLTTARAGTRTKEVGVRKIIGAGERQVFGLLFAESLWTTLAALILGVLLVAVALPYFNQLTENTFRLTATNPVIWGVAGGTWLAALLLSGLYPAFFLTGFAPKQFLEGQSLLRTKNATFRSGLVVGQVALTAGLLFGALVLYQQRTFVQSKDLGYDRSRVFEFTIPYSPDREERIRQLERRLAADPAVVGTAKANGSIIDMQGSHSGSLDWDGRPADFVPTVAQLSVDENFAELLQIPLRAGRWFRAGDPAEERHVILNQKAIEHLGLTEPVVGRRFAFRGQEGQIIGVVENFHFESLREAIEPLVLFTQPIAHGTVLVKPAPGQVAAGLAAAQRVWSEVFPTQPFEYQFLDDHFAQLYRTETHIAGLFRLLALLAIGLSALGLFGLSLFVAEQRRREIGIRKVLGAGVPRLVRQLAADLVRLVGIALAIGIPLAGYWADRWLQQYAYRIELRWWYFATVALGVLLVALLTVSVQSIRTALANPAQTLKE
jgi:predicted permease